MTPTTHSNEVLTELSADFGELRSCYSGRGMFGDTCIGIVTSSPAELIEAAANRGVRGAKTDGMGLETIVYWPSVQ